MTAAIISITVGYVASIASILWYLGNRIDRLEDRFDARMDKLDTRMGKLDETLQELRQDVAVLKATNG